MQNLELTFFLLATIPAFVTLSMKNFYDSTISLIGKIFNPILMLIALVLFILIVIQRRRIRIKLK
jgi:hypothetical protein